MNRNIKFHKPKSPAFNAGEVWVGSSGFKVEIVSVRKYPGATNEHSSDYGVTYQWSENGKIVQHEKDCWNFQVRYTHVADLVVKGKK